MQCNVMQHLACQWAHLIYQFNSSPRPPKNLQSGEDLKIFRKKKIKKKQFYENWLSFSLVKHVRQFTASGFRVWFPFHIHLPCNKRFWFGLSLTAHIWCIFAESVYCVLVFLWCCFFFPTPVDRNPSPPEHQQTYVNLTDEQAECGSQHHGGKHPGLAVFNWLIGWMHKIYIQLGRF